MTELLETALEWWRAHPALLTWLVWIGVASWIGSLVLLPWVFARLPANAFVGRGPRFRTLSPPLRIAALVLKNALGAALLAAGVALLFLPGQGLLTIVLALLLIDFPGKRRLERWILRRHALRRGLDWIRDRAGRERFVFDEPQTSSPSAASAARTSSESSRVGAGSPASRCRSRALAARRSFRRRAW